MFFGERLDFFQFGWKIIIVSGHGYYIEGIYEYITFPFLSFVISRVVEYLSPEVSLPSFEPTHG